MIALGASLFLLFYVLVPGGIFRFALSLVVPVKKFHKTRSQEISFAVLASFLPFWLAMALVWSFATSPFQTNKESNHDRRRAYRTVFTSMDDEKTLAKCLDQGVFWPAINSVLRRQARFLIWFYILVIIEAAVFWWLASRYGRYKRHPIYAFIAEQLFLSISEWHILLTDFAVRTDVTRDIEVDILTTEGILYQGRVDDYILNAEGELSGILLSDASKFEKSPAEYIHADLPQGLSSGPAVLEATISSQSAPAKLKKINGSNLFFPRERISNLNTRHRPLAPAEVQRATEVRLQDRGIKLTVSENATPPDTPIKSTSPSTTVQTPKVGT